MLEGVGGSDSYTHILATIQDSSIFEAWVDPSL